MFYFKLFQTKLNIESFLADCEKIYSKNEDNREFNDKECVCMDFVDKKWMKVQKLNLIDVKTIYYTNFVA